jgi:hypothetical protein
MSRFRDPSVRLVAFILCLVTVVLSHEHHDTAESIPLEKATAPIDWILWVHIALQGVVWGILFPIGMVLGLAGSRWHVPLQVSAS